MQISSLVNTLPNPILPDAPTAPASPGGAPPPPPAASAVPSFITPASLVSVSGGTAAVSLLWRAAKQIFGVPDTNQYVPLCCALIVGAIIYGISLGDSKTALSMRDKAIGAAIAILNSLVLYFAAKGVLT